MIPKYDPNKKCKCGYPYDGGDPELSSWIFHEDSAIHTGVVSIQVTTYYRPTIGNCNCKQSYDGRSDLLINLNNKHLFTYVWLVKILHNTQATRFPLYSAYTSSNDCRVFSNNLLQKRNHYEDL